MFTQRLAKFSDICHNENMNKNRGVRMTLRLKENIEQKNFLITQSPSHLITLKNVCCGFDLNNIHRVGKADLRTDTAGMEWKAERAHRNVGKFLQMELTPLSILTPLTFAPCDRAKTRMNTEFCGGGGAKL